MPSKQPSGNALGVRPYVSQTGAFTNGSDSPRAFLERCLEVSCAGRCRRRLCDLEHRGARAAADASTARWKAGATLSPIDGMPVGIKDIMETADMATEQGSLYLSAGMANATALQWRRCAKPVRWCSGKR